MEDLSYLQTTYAREKMIEQYNYEAKEIINMNEVEVTTGKELTTEVKQDVSLFVQNARDLVIVSEQDLIYARDNIRAGRALKDKITEWFKGMKAKAKAAHQEICDKEKAELDPVIEGTNIYNTKITNFQLAEQKRIAEENRKAEESARKKKEAAQKKAQERIDALADKCLGTNEQIVELQSSLNNPEMSVDERDVIEAKISSLMVCLDSTKQNIVETQTKIEDILEAPAPTPVAVATKVKGVGGLKPVLIPEIKNPYVLLAAVANKSVPLTVVNFDMVKIKRLVNDGMPLPGVITIETHKTNVR